MKLPDFDFHFFANEGETVAYGWPFPFTYTSRPVKLPQIMITGCAATSREHCLLLR